MADILAQIETADYSLVYLPPYSPDFIPIELVFSTLKAPFSRLAGRTQDTLEVVIAEAVAAISVQDAVTFFHHDGSHRKDQPV